MVAGFGLSSPRKRGPRSGKLSQLKELDFRVRGNDAGGSNAFLHRAAVVGFLLQVVEKGLELRHAISADLLGRLGNQPRRDVLQEAAQRLDGGGEARRF